MTDEKLDETLDTSIDVPFNSLQKAIFTELAREDNRKPAQLLRLLAMNYIREHIKIKEDEK
jgi:hypothetical protein